MTPTFRTSRPDNWTQPRGNSGLSREHVHGKLLPMEEPRRSWWRRLLGRV